MISNSSSWECNDDSPDKTQFQILINGKRIIMRSCNSHKLLLDDLQVVKTISYKEIISN